MSGLPNGIIEGVFAVNKPGAISSAQVIRNLQSVFNPSALFAPWLKQERAKRDAEIPFQRKRRRDQRLQVKIGHGGTLDPMATGVLIMGVGQGTKRLQEFLTCTKAYEATLIFGGATDTYDTQGKTVKRAPYKHITRIQVEEALKAFRGKIMQTPPIYSALRIDGKKLYEYAREGKELPRAIQERPVEVLELEVIDWMESNAHPYKLPEAASELAGHVTEPAAQVLNTLASAVTSISGDVGQKRKRETLENDGAESEVKRQEMNHEHVTSEVNIFSPQVAKVVEISQTIADLAPTGDKAVLVEDTEDAGPPAVTLRMVVTSGFYVRSLAHDLGAAVGSLGCMCRLVRTRQGQFELGRNVVSYEEFQKPESEWALRLKELMSEE